MLKRPTSRRRTKDEQINLNLVPILDAMVTLIAFLLYTMSFLALGSIESPFPTASSSDMEEKLKEKPLQLTVTVRDDEVEIWSPFSRIAPRNIPNAQPRQPDLKAVHEALIAIKTQFPTEKRVILVPTGGVTYDTLIAVMDSVRGLEPGDPPIYAKNAQTQVDEQLKALFPDVVFGNLLGDT